MSTLADKFKDNYPNTQISWEDLEQIARDYLTNELYEQAAGLFDPNTRLNIEKDEYQRGVTELVMRFTGTDSDDKEDVAEVISQRTGIYRLTAADFGTGFNGDALYIGPLEPAITFVKQTCQWSVKQTQNGLVHVELDGGNCFGVADTLELAWRYALAAELYGNSGETFEPFLLKP